MNKIKEMQESLGEKKADGTDYTDDEKRALVGAYAQEVESKYGSTFSNNITKQISPTLKPKYGLFGNNFFGRG